MPTFPPLPPLRHSPPPAGALRPRRPGAACALSLAVLCGLGAAAAGCSREPDVTQPIAFNHKRHIEAKMDCLGCHEQAGDKPAATLPVLAKCMECHEEAKGKSPDEPKIREYAKRGEDIPWVQVNVYPGHVYFSHRAHVGIAEMDCAVCHGNMKEVDKPVSRRNVHLDMAGCIACHRQKNATVECIDCHK